MKQFEYLNKLRENLKGELPAETVEDILSDYESFFEAGREEGKTDDEISAELGSPALLAKSLLEVHENGQAIQLDKHIAQPWRRLSAYLIDAIIAALPLFVLEILLNNIIASIGALMAYPAPGIALYVSIAAAAYTDFSTTSGNAVYYNRDFIASVVCIIFYMLYSLIFTLIFKGQTIGKKLMSIRVCSSDTSNATFGRIFTREFVGKVLLNSIPLLPIISLFTLILTKEHKTLHDMLADTIVVEVR